MTNVFINLTNHPSSKWSDDQVNAAKKLFVNGDVEIVDIPFPQIDPNLDKFAILDLVNEYIDKISLVMKEKNTQNVIVHVMGEMTFTYNIVKELMNSGIVCVASTTDRIVEEDANGVKKSIFKFNQFRKY